MEYRVTCRNCRLAVTTKLFPTACRACGSKRITIAHDESLQIDGAVSPVTAHRLPLDPMFADGYRNGRLDHLNNVRVMVAWTNETTYGEGYREGWRARADLLYRPPADPWSSVRGRDF